MAPSNPMPSTIPTKAARSIGMASILVTNSIGYASNGTLPFAVPSVYGAKFENLGSGLEVDMPNGSLTANGTTFPFAQFHFHTPSEHRVNEEYYPMECHFVFQAKCKHRVSRRVLSNRMLMTWYRRRDCSDCIPPRTVSLWIYHPSLRLGLCPLDDISSPGTFTTTGWLDFSGVIRHFDDHGVYEYTGSPTTPPCSKNVCGTSAPSPSWSTFNNIMR
jgi:hypothetical protein